MSNYLAIATVTATLQRTLQAAIQVDLPGAKVTTVRPDGSGSKTPEVGVNIYMYQAIPNPAWRNADLRNRRPKGDLIKQAQAGLDLYFLMTFYGNEVELEPQRLLGSTLRTLVDQPILTAEIIRETVSHPSFKYLADSTLEQQAERVTIVPLNMTTEELSKIWSVFFQTPYTLSFACQGGVVLIEGYRPSGRGLPLRTAQFFTAPNQAIIEQVSSENGFNQPILANSNLMIRGKQLSGDEPQANGNFPQRRGATQVKIGEAKVTPQRVSETEIRLELSSLPEPEKNAVRAGVQALQIIYSIVPKRISTEPERAIGSNVVPFVLCPTIQEIRVLEVSDNGDDSYSAEVVVQIDLIVGQQQQVFLMLNERLAENPAAYIFAAKLRNADTNLVVFSISDFKPGEYLVRVQVDGAESPLEWDKNVESQTFGQYTGPSLAIGLNALTLG
ncbi:DUF4255 domain-containing protein [Aerosakkonemataceae cyanobacterium BLCC-F50]|uniref:DUF4255 domain-containing protein n=1 Tax=Floridaenema flaviceps BLCC-F50 TaxID=3153642 RepID=A0ABV4XJ61_9CYAN